MSELSAVVRRNRLQMRHPVQQGKDGIGHLLGTLGSYPADEGEARFALGECHQSALVTLADDQIDLPVAQARAAIHHRWTLFNAGLGRDFAPPIMATVAFAAFFLTAQVFVQLASGALVSVNVLVNVFVADLKGMALLQATGNLLWAPIQFQLLLNQGPIRGAKALLAAMASSQGHLMRLFGTITALPPVAAQLPTNGRFVYPQKTGDLRLVVSHFLQSINLVSLFLGKLLVAHKRSFDLVGLGGLCYRSLPLFPTFKVAL